MFGSPTCASFTKQRSLEGTERLGGPFGPEKKNLAPPPIPQFTTHTLPAPSPPPPSWETLPPFLGFSIKNRPPPPCRPGLPLQKIKNIRNVHQEEGRDRKSPGAARGGQGEEEQKNLRAERAFRASDYRDLRHAGEMTVEAVGISNKRGCPLPQHSAKTVKGPFQLSWG